MKIVVRNRSLIQVGELDLSLTAVEQICDTSQTRAITDILVYLSKKVDKKSSSGKDSLGDLLDQLESSFDSEVGLDVFFSPERLRGNCARPRRFEIAAAINRLRCAHFSQ